MRILLVEENIDLAKGIGEFLEARGHEVEQGHDAETGLALARGDSYDAIILDIGPPGIDGLTLCRELRKSPQCDTPVVILTARATEADKLSGFDAGADDYVTKPFSLLELLARLEALVRRAGRRPKILQVADLTFDVRTLLIQRGSRCISLAPIGLRILQLLMQSSPAMVTRKQIERAVWGNKPPGTDAALRAHIFLIRSAVDAEGEPKLLHTIHTLGYRLLAQRP
jgi:DNA-binding response OmpR family regulator